LNLVKSTRLESDSNSLLVHFITEAPVEHLVDNALHFDVDDGWVWIVDLAIDDLLSQLGVSIDALVDKSFNVHALLIQVEQISGLKCKSKSLIKLLKVVKHLGSN
jgi:hypothetical protein